jgi:hypothetical protein
VLQEPVAAYSDDSGGKIESLRTQLQKVERQSSMQKSTFASF